MKKRFVALTLVLALILTIGAVTAVAGEETAVKVLETAAPGLLIAPNPNTSATEAKEDVSLAGPDEKTVSETKLDEETETLITKVTTEPTKLENLTFDQLEKQLRGGNLSLLALEENIVMLETMDYKELEDDLRDTLNMIASMQWGMLQQSQAFDQPVDSNAMGQLDQQYAALEVQFDAIYKGELQEDNAGLIRQLNSLQDQIVMGGEPCIWPWLL